MSCAGTHIGKVLIDTTNNPTIPTSASSSALATLDRRHEFLSINVLPPLQMLPSNILRCSNIMALCSLEIAWSTIACALGTHVLSDCPAISLALLPDSWAFGSNQKLLIISCPSMYQFYALSSSGPSTTFLQAD